jgi:hypothetical protein
MRARNLVALLAFAFMASTAMTASPPRDIDDAHRDLEEWLGPIGVRKAKKARSEEDMMYHVIGLEGAVSLTNRWHLWDSSPLAQYCKRLGVTPPHDMVGMITATYWCRIHGKPLRLREHAAYWRDAEAKNPLR